MNQACQLARPVVARCASFDANKAGSKTLKERQYLRPSQGTIEGDFAVVCDPMDLKDVLGQIQADGGNLHGVAPLIGRYGHLHSGALRRRLEQQPSTPSVLDWYRSTDQNCRMTALRANLTDAADCMNVGSDDASRLHWVAQFEARLARG